MMSRQKSVRFSIGTDVIPDDVTMGVDSPGKSCSRSREIQSGEVRGGGPKSVVDTIAVGVRAHDHSVHADVIALSCSRSGNRNIETEATFL